VSEQPWPEVLALDGPVMLALSGDTMWLSPDASTVYQQPVSAVDTSTWRALELSTVVAYDVKQLYHDLAAQGQMVRFGTVHDIRQAAFLIDPLRRDRSLSALVGEELLGPQAEIQGMWQVYGWQEEAFTNAPQVAEVAGRLAFPGMHPLFLMGRRGIRVDNAQLAAMRKELTEGPARLEQEMFTLVGYEFKIGSRAQLSDLLFTKRQLP